MSASLPTFTRVSVRVLLAFSLILVALLVLLPAPAAYAAEKKVFGDITVGPGERPGSVSTVFGDVKVNGRVDGNVKSGFGDIEVYAPVGGTVDADFGDVLVGAPIRGDLNVGHGEVEWMPGGEIRGDLYCPDCAMAELPDDRIGGEMYFGAAPGLDGSSGGSGVLGFISWFFATLVFVAISVLAAVLVPRPIESSAQKVEESVGRSLLVGLASVPAALVLAVVLGVSIVGIPLLLLAAPAYVAFVFFGAVVAAYFVGRRILFATGRYHGGNALAAAIGALILAVAYMIPFLGGLIFYSLALLGTGGVILALLSRRRTPTAYSSYESYVGDQRL
jgi:hypothetical protein